MKTPQFDKLVKKDVKPEQETFSFTITCLPKKLVYQIPVIFAIAQSEQEKLAPVGWFFDQDHHKMVLVIISEESFVISPSHLYPSVMETDRGVSWKDVPLPHIFLE